MTLLIRLLSRLIGMIWTLLLALLGLGVALYCLDGAIRLGSGRPDRLLGLEGVRRHVGRFLDQVAAPGSAAGLALLCGLGAMAIGVLLMIGLLRSPRERQAILQDDDEGRIAARPRTLRELAGTLAREAPEPVAVARPKLRLARHGTRGRLRVSATSGNLSDPDSVRAALNERLAPLTEPFHLRTKVSVEPGERGERVR